MPQRSSANRTHARRSRPFWKRALLPGGLTFLGIAVVAALVWLGRPEGNGADARGADLTEGAVHIFYGSTCHDCPPYVAEQAMPALQTRPWPGGVKVHDFQKPEELRLLTRTLDEVGFGSPPADVARVLTPATFHVAVLRLDQSQVILLGHPPGNLVRDVLSLGNPPPRLVVSQEEMHGAATKYEVWDFEGAVASFPIGTPLKDALARMSASR